MKPGAAVTAAPPPPKRMTLQSVTKGKKVGGARRTLVHGVDGIGKTTFGADAPSPIFVGPEDGSGQIDVARFPTPENFGDVLEAVRTLTTDPHDYKTLAVDSLDWIEPLIWREVCVAAKVDSIEDVGGGYGRGYNAALDKWRLLVAAFDRLYVSRGMNVVLIAHTLVKNFKNPAGEDYERYQIKINEKAAGLLREWCDDVLFANYGVVVAQNAKTKRVRGVATGERLLHTVYSAAWDAKNRHNLPDSINLSWADYDEAVNAGQVADSDALIEEITRKAKECGGVVEKQTLESLAKVGSDAVKLAKLNSWVNSKHSAATAQKEG